MAARTDQTSCCKKGNYVLHRFWFIILALWFMRGSSTVLAQPSQLQIEPNDDPEVSLNSTLELPSPHQTLVLSNGVGIVATAESELQKGVVGALAPGGGIDSLLQPAKTLHPETSIINTDNILTLSNLDVEGVTRPSQTETKLGETASRQLAIGNPGECAERCALDQCHGHGICHNSDCSCVCYEGFSGSFCEERVTVVSNFRLRPLPKPCPDSCGGHGMCLYNGTCSCDRGWAGFNCSMECLGGAANPCSGHGICNRTDGKCFCSEGYEGKACARKTPAQNVSEFRKTRLGGQAEVADVKGLKSSEPNTPDVEHLSKDRKATEPAHQERNPENASSVDAGIASNSTTSTLSSDKFIKGIAISSSKLSTFGDNHASFDLGAKTLGTNKEAKGENSLLKHDRDKYWISPCVLEKGVNWFAIELNEEVYVHTLVLGTFEYYSSTIKHFQLLGQIKYPTDSWKVLGSFQALPDRQYQYFKLRKPLLAKYIKIRVLSHYGNEFYCTLSSVRVYGNTQWEEMARHFVVNEEFVEQAKRRLVDSPAETAPVTHEKSEDPVTNPPPAVPAHAMPEVKLSGNDDAVTSIVPTAAQTSSLDSSSLRSSEGSTAAAGLVQDVTDTVAVDSSSSPQVNNSVDNYHPVNSTANEDSNSFPILHASDTSSPAITEALLSKEINISTREVEQPGVTYPKDGGAIPEAQTSASNVVEQASLSVANIRPLDTVGRPQKPIQPVPEAEPQPATVAVSDVGISITLEASQAAIVGTTTEGRIASLKEEFAKTPADGFPGVEQAAAAVAAAAAAAASAAAAYLVRGSHVTDTKASGTATEVMAGGEEADRPVSTPVGVEQNGEFVAGRASSALESPTEVDTTATDTMPIPVAAPGLSAAPAPRADGADYPSPALTTVAGAGSSEMPMAGDGQRHSFGMITSEGSRGDGKGGGKVWSEGQSTPTSPIPLAAHQTDSVSNVESVGPRAPGLGHSSAQDEQQPLLPAMHISAAQSQQAGPRTAVAGPDAVGAASAQGPVIVPLAGVASGPIAASEVPASAVATSIVHTAPKGLQGRDCGLDSTCGPKSAVPRPADSAELNPGDGTAAAGRSEEDSSSSTLPASTLAGSSTLPAVTTSPAGPLKAEAIEASECHTNGEQNRTEVTRSAGAGLGMDSGGESPAVQSTGAGPAVRGVPVGGDSPPEVVQLRDASGDTHGGNAATVSDGVMGRAAAVVEAVEGDRASSGAVGDRAANEPDADATAAVMSTAPPSPTEGPLPATASPVTARASGIASHDEDSDKAVAAAAAAAAAVRRDADEEGAGSARRADDEAQQRRRRPEETRGMVGPKGGKGGGELSSFFVKLPAKIMDLEINQSLLQSYIQEIKQHYDETLHDVQEELKAVQASLEGVGSGAQLAVLNLTERVAALQHQAAALDRAHKDAQRAAGAQAESLERLREAVMGGPGPAAGEAGEAAGSWARWRGRLEALVVVLAAAIVVRQWPPRLTAAADALATAARRSLRGVSWRFSRHTALPPTAPSRRDTPPAAAGLVGPFGRMPRDGGAGGVSPVLSALPFSPRAGPALRAPVLHTSRSAGEHVGFPGEAAGWPAAAHSAAAGGKRKPRSPAGGPLGQAGVGAGARDWSSSSSGGGAGGPGISRTQSYPCPPRHVGPESSGGAGGCSGGSNGVPVGAWAGAARSASSSSAPQQPKSGPCARTRSEAQDRFLASLQHSRSCGALLAALARPPWSDSPGPPAPSAGGRCDAGRPAASVAPPAALGRDGIAARGPGHDPHAAAPGPLDTARPQVWGGPDLGRLSQGRSMPDVLDLSRDRRLGDAGPPARRSGHATCFTGRFQVLALTDESDAESGPGSPPPRRGFPPAYRDAMAAPRAASAGRLPGSPSRALGGSGAAVLQSQARRRQPGHGSAGGGGGGRAGPSVLAAA